METLVVMQIQTQGVHTFISATFLQTFGEYAEFDLYTLNLIDVHNNLHSSKMHFKLNKYFTNSFLIKDLMYIISTQLHQMKTS